jgi:tetratricopeptide (TPR) repeat protein
MVLLAAVGALLAAAGCRTAARPAPVLVTAEEGARLPGRVQQKLNFLAQDGERNAVLNLTEVAAAALDAGPAVPPELQKLVIDQALDEAILRIETVYANTAAARQARSLWHAESVKDFKGEPYERAFVYLLRGLRYYQAGDVGNARACFTSGILQDSLSEEGEFNADMASFELLLALCHARLGEPQQAAEAYARAQKLGYTGPPPGAGDNLLVVVLAGSGPQKRAVGEYRQILYFAPGPQQARQLVLTAPGASGVTLPRAEDFYFQATTRGGRAVDEINKRKAFVKGTTDTIGDVAIIGGAIAALGSNRDSYREAGLIVLAAGLLFKIGAATMTASADARGLTCVPTGLYLWSGQVPPGAGTVQLRAQGEQTDRQLRADFAAADSPAVVLFRTP